MKIYNRQIRIPLAAELPTLFILLYLPAYLAQGSGIPGGYFDHPGAHLQMIVTSFVYIGLILYMLDRIPSPSLPEQETGFAPFRAGDFFRTLAGLILIYLLFAVLLTSVLKRTGLIPVQEDPVLLTKGAMLLPVGVTCLFSAAQEELFFRAYGYIRLRQTGQTPRNSMIVMSLLFSAGHLYEGIPALIYALAAGLFLARQIYRGASLFSLIPAHALLNFLVILLNYMTEGRN